MRALLVLVLVGGFLSPVAVAADPSEYGSAEEPEIRDALQDIVYSSLHLGSRDHSYLDLASSWFWYDNTTDNVMVRLGVADMSKLPSTAQEWDIDCYVEGNLTTAGRVLGMLRFQLEKPNHNEKVFSNVTFRPASTDAIATDVKHDFAIERTSPGFGIFAVNRTRMQNMGDEIVGLKGLCAENYHPETHTPSVIVNYDLANSRASYSFMELRPTRTEAGEEIPWSTTPTESVSSTSPEPVSPKRSASVGAVSAAFCLMAVILARIRR